MAVMAGFPGDGICGQRDVLSQPQGLQPRRRDDRQQRAFDEVHWRAEPRHIRGCGRIFALLRQGLAIHSIHAPANHLADRYRRALPTASGTYPAPGRRRGGCDQGNRRER